MGLSKDIENVFLDVMGYDNIDDDVTKDAMKLNAQKMGNGISKSIVNWIKKQEFNITKMKAILQLEELSTTGPMFADVQQSLMAEIPLSSVFVAPAGIPNPIPWPVMMNSLTTKKAVKIPKLRLSKTAGQGGSMVTKGYAYIGPNNPINPAESNENKTTVKLVRVKEA